MKALVTGATGFVGSHLVDRLLAAGDEVTALVRSPTKAAGLAERGVRLVQGDLHDLRALADAVRGQDVVQHVAALVGAVDEAEFLRANRDGTANLVTAVQREAPEARFVLTSSLAA
ncbi:MAG: NAD-dependent epimerase/dehydratase family protein, partial [Gemmatimonadales bacterium]